MVTPPRTHSSVTRSPQAQEAGPAAPLRHRVPRVRAPDGHPGGQWDHRVWGLPEVSLQAATESSQWHLAPGTHRKVSTRGKESDMSEKLPSSLSQSSANQKPSLGQREGEWAWAVWLSALGDRDKDSEANSPVSESESKATGSPLEIPTGLPPSDQSLEHFRDRLGKRQDTLPCTEWELGAGLGVFSAKAQGGIGSCQSLEHRQLKPRVSKQNPVRLAPG